MKIALSFALLAGFAFAQQAPPPTCNEIPSVTLAVRRYTLSPPTPSDMSVAVTMTGKITQPAECTPIGATFIENTDGAPGASGPVAVSGTDISQIVTVPLPPPPRRAPARLTFVVTAFNEAGYGRSPAAQLIVP